MYSNSSTVTVSGCDWSNMILHGTSTGEVQGVTPGQLYIDLDLDRRIKNKRFMICYNEIVDRNLISGNGNAEEPNSSSSDPLTYSEVEQKYSLLFYDFDLVSSLFSQK